MTVTSTLNQLFNLYEELILTYDKAIERMSTNSHRRLLETIKIKHIQNIEDLKKLIDTYTIDVQNHENQKALLVEKDLKTLLIHSKISIASLFGDTNVLQILKTSEEHLKKTYQSILRLDSLDPELFRLLKNHHKNNQHSLKLLTTVLHEP